MRYPRRGTWTSTGPPAALIAWNTACGSRAGAPPSTAPSVTSTVGQRRRRVTGSATRSAHQPLSTKAWLSAVRAWPPMSTAASSRVARVSRTSRVCGYGARGSAYRSSPSSNIATRPRSATGANAAPRVPSTTRTAPRATARNARFRSSGFCDPVSSTCRPSPSTVVKISCQRATSRTSGTHTMLPRPACSVARTASATASAGSWAGRAAQQARGRSPAASAATNDEPCGHQFHASSVTAGSGPSTAWLGRASARACRGGTARRRTSLSVPAQRSATALHSPSTAGDSTGSAETTLLRKARSPSWSLVSTRSMTKASASRPEKRTRTRHPGTTSASIVVGTR